MAPGAEGEHLVPELVALRDLAGAGLRRHDRLADRRLGQRLLAGQGIAVLAATVEESVPGQPGEEGLEVGAVVEVPAGIAHPGEHVGQDRLDHVH